MKSLIRLSLIAALCAGCAAHRAPDRPSSRLGAITEASVRGHLEFLAGDALNGRGSGTRDEWIAAAYIGAQLRRWGVEPLGDDGGYVQEVQIERREATSPPVLTLQGQRFTHGKEIAASRIGGTRLEGPLQKYRTGTAVTQGAVLLLPETNPPPAEDTVAATLVLSSGAPGARPGGPAVVQHIVGVPERATVTLDKNTYATFAAAADGVPVSLTTEAKRPEVRHTWNAIGRLPGSAPADAGDVILLSAHLDHLGARVTAGGAAGSDSIYNGADDDASGSVAVLELAEALAAGRRPKRTIIFVWFGSEEAGGFGASHFIDAPPVPLDRIVANLEFEMIGRADKAVPAHTLWLTGYERSDLGPALAKQGAKIVRDPHPAQSFFTRSDNIQLARRGVIAQTISSFGLHGDYHRPSDEVKTIDIAHMADSIRSMVAPVLWLANSGFRPKWRPGMKP